MKPLSIHRPYFGLAGVAFCLLGPALHAQTATAPVATAPSEEAAEHLRSRLFIYDLHDGSSHLVYTAASIWEAPIGLLMERICSPTPADIFIDSRSEKAELRSHKNWSFPPSLNAITTRPSLRMARSLPSPRRLPA
jgi:hypothetical protein